MRAGEKADVGVRTVAILGAGLLGGSLAMALRAFCPDIRVHLSARRKQTLRLAEDLAIADRLSSDVSEVVPGADMVILATPVQTFGKLADAVIPVLGEKTLVTDVGSVKEFVHREIGDKLTLSGHYFIGSHPMAGAEKQGLVAARSDLFVNSTVVLTNPHRVPEPYLIALDSFWRSLGAADTVLMTPADHDEEVARISHLPHALAALCARASLHDAADVSSLSALAASGYHDTTRICAGNAEMWAGIFLSNGRCIGNLLRACAEDIRNLGRLIDEGDADALTAWLENARRCRDLIVKSGKGRGKGQRY